MISSTEPTSRMFSLTSLVTSIFPLKNLAAKDETEAKAKLSEAIEQIKTRDYGNIVPRKDELLRIAAVFNADPKVRAFTEFQLV